jgi:hypothetical protein
MVIILIILIILIDLFYLFLFDIIMLAVSTVLFSSVFVPVLVMFVTFVQVIEHVFRRHGLTAEVAYS